MGAVEQESKAVESYLSALEQSYDSFSINQRTVSVSPEQYEREHAEAGAIEVYTRVENEQQEVLYTEENGAVRLPSTRISIDDSLEPTAVATVSDRTGVDCAITALDTVTILGLRNDRAEETETLYRLAVLFDAKQTGGTADESALWKPYSTEMVPEYLG